MTQCIICQEAYGYAGSDNGAHRRGPNHPYGVWVVAHRLDWVSIRDNEWPVLQKRGIALDVIQAPVFKRGLNRYWYNWARRSDVITYLSELETEPKFPLRLQQLLARAKDPNSNGQCHTGYWREQRTRTAMDSVTPDTEEVSFKYYVLMRSVFLESSYWEVCDGGTPLAIIDSDREGLEQLAFDLTLLTCQQVSLEHYWPYCQENDNPRRLEKTWALLDQHFTTTGVREFKDYEAWFDRRYPAPKDLPLRYYETLAEEVEDFFYYVEAVPIDTDIDAIRRRLLEEK